MPGASYNNSQNALLETRENHRVIQPLGYLPRPYIGATTVMTKSKLPINQNQPMPIASKSSPFFADLIPPILTSFLTCLIPLMLCELVYHEIVCTDTVDTWI